MDMPWWPVLPRQSLHWPDDGMPEPTWLEEQANGIIDYLQSRYEHDCYTGKRRNDHKKFRCFSAGVVEGPKSGRVLSAAQTLEMKQIMTGCLLRSGLAGTLSSLCSGIAAILTYRRYPDMTLTHSTWDVLHQPHLWACWGVILFALLLCSALEVLYLYYDALCTGLQMAHVAGLVLSPQETECRLLTRSIAHTALRLPHDSNEKFGINPCQKRQTVGPQDHLFKVLPHQDWVQGPSWRGCVLVPCVVP